MAKQVRLWWYIPASTENPFVQLETGRPQQRDSSMAINEACTFLTSLPSEGSSVANFTDSLSSVYALSGPSSLSRLCIETRSSLDNLASTCGSVVLTWIRGHAGVQRYDLADAGAKRLLLNHSPESNHVTSLLRPLCPDFRSKH